ncbi:MAG: hypothetical protein HYR62_02005 [Actinobacteria bacterium]|nr:hypothetical protein [Actinomycetota bacterium]MBI3687257.1 hypothetical protein [Actinomycetota bacterium]
MTTPDVNRPTGGHRYHSYRLSGQIAAAYDDFYALLMACMRKADTDNARALRAMWPDVWAELQARYNAPAGLLDGETGGES